MSEKKVAVVQPRSLAKGLIAGLIGGLVGTLAKTLAERIFPPRTHQEPEPSEVLADRVVGHPLDPDTRTVVAESIQWGLGAAIGAAYGAVAEFYPIATAKQGASFGMALEGLAQEAALPALGLSPEPEDQTTRDRASEITSHVVYGVTTETVRSLVRKLL